MFGLFKRKKQDPRAELTKALGGAELPTFPAILMQVLESLRDEKASLSKIADLVSADPGLSVKVLRTVNCAAYGLRRRVDNIAHAVNLLGRGRLESIVLAMAVNDSMPSTPVPGFKPRRFWRAAARRASAAQALAEVLDPKSRAVSFTAALLQDMAVPLLAHNRGGYAPVLEQWRQDGGSLEDMERSEFGWDHAEVATWISAEWEFPEPLAAAIGGHHGADEPELKSPAPVQLVALMGEEDDRRLDIEPMVETARDRFGAPPDRVVAAVELGLERYEDVARLFAA